MFDYDTASNLRNPKKFVLQKASAAISDQISRVTATITASDPDLRWYDTASKSHSKKIAELDNKIKALNKEFSDAVEEHFSHLITEKDREPGYRYSLDVYKHKVIDSMKNKYYALYTEFEMKVVLAGKENLIALLDNLLKSLKTIK